jgi:toxin ParE1/3/4
MARIELLPEVFADFDRFFEHMTQFDINDAPERIGEIIEAMQILTHSPLIGRAVRSGRRELVIGQGARGYIPLYRYLENIDTVFILGMRSQRELGYKRRRR